VHCFDDAERGMGLKGVFEVRDPETRRVLALGWNSPTTRRQLAEFQVRLSHRLEEVSRKARADYLCLSSKDDYLQRLVQYFRGPRPCSRLTWAPRPPLRRQCLRGPRPSYARPRSMRNGPWIGNLPV